MTSPSLLVICGPPAVGKMTVGQELAQLSGMKLLYNHQFIDLLTPYFEFGSDGFFRIARLYEREFMREAAAAGLQLIFTWGWRFNVPGDGEHMRELTGLFRDAGGDARVVELAAPIDVRLERNRSEYRRTMKRMDWATDDALRALDVEHRYNSGGSFPIDMPHLYVDTRELSAVETAQRIRDWLGREAGASQARRTTESRREDRTSP